MKAHTIDFGCPACQAKSGTPCRMVRGNKGKPKGTLMRTFHPERHGLRARRSKPREKPVVFESYGLFLLDDDGLPVSWLEINGDQNELTPKLTSGHGVFGVEIVVRRPRTTGAICP